MSVGNGASAGVDVNVSGLEYNRASTITIDFEFVDFEFDRALPDEYSDPDDEYSKLLSQTIDEIVDALNEELGLPSEGDYGSPAFDQKAFLTRLGQIVARELESAPCRYDYQIEFKSELSKFPYTDSHSLSMCGEEQFVEATWKAEVSKLTIHTGNLALAVESKRQLMGVDSRTPCSTATAWSNAGNARRHKARGTPLSAAHEPNGLWRADFKGRSCSATSSTATHSPSRTIAPAICSPVLV